MIFDTIDNFEKYAVTNDKFKLALDFFKNNNLKNIATGKYEIYGDDIYVVIQDYQTKKLEEGKLEAHRKYIDIQYVIDGEEQIGFAKLSDTKPSTFYDEEKDIIFLNGESQLYTATPDNFFIFYPEDAHMPSIATKEPEPVKKAVFKIKVD